MIRCFLRKFVIGFCRSEALPIIIIGTVTVAVYVAIYLLVEYARQRWGEDAVGEVLATFIAVLVLLLIACIICQFLKWCIRTWQECREG